MSWVAQSEVARELETTLKYDKPAFIVWFNHTLQILLIPAEYIAFSRRRGSSKESWTETLRGSGMTMSRLCTMSLFLSAAIWTADYVWYIGLDSCDVSTGTAVFNSTSVFVSILSYVLLGTRPTIFALSALAVTLAGVGLVAYASANDRDDSGDGTTTTEQIKGACLVLLAAMLYAVFEVFFSVRSKERLVRHTHVRARARSNATNSIDRHRTNNQWFFKVYGIREDASMANLVNGALGVFNVCVLCTSLASRSISPRHRALT